jgi:glucosamine-6-phosphate deaminase
VQRFVDETTGAMAARAAADAAAVIGAAVATAGRANVMLATGNSQLAFLAALAGHQLDWSRVTCFHMDEYVGIDAGHPASFRRYLRERVEAVVRPRAFHYIEGDAADPEAECRRYAALLADHPLDLCCLGIGENGHLAFNDPPVADFDDPQAVKVVTLDDACRRQQVGEGHFATVDQVPPRAITVTIPALLAAATVMAVVPEARKAEPVRRALTEPVSTACPATVLRTRANVRLYLDAGSASRL